MKSSSANVSEDKMEMFIEDTHEKSVAEHLAKEWQKAEDTFNNESVKHTISIFGSARIPSDDKDSSHPCHKMTRFYHEAQQLSFELGKIIESKPNSGIRLLTGGGPGIMEAASRGAFEAGHASIGLNIKIPHEQRLNPFITAKHSIEFQYFALRKMHFLRQARALIVFPGGFGTLDELFETLTLIQTKKMDRVPVLLYGKEFWNQLINLQVLENCGLIDQLDESLYQVVDSVEEAVASIQTVMTFLVEDISKP